MLDSNTPKPRLIAEHRLNPIGLDPAFTLEGDDARAEINLNEHHQGPDGYIHQGILAFLMDEGMGWISRHGAGVNSVTARMEIEYLRPARIDKPLVVIVRIAKNTRRLLEITARIESCDGLLLAEGTCLQYIMEAKSAGTLLRSRE
jgi:uncharacterized protein (TIGR00369 family)